MQSKLVLKKRNRQEKWVEILIVKLTERLNRVQYIKGILKIVSSLKKHFNDSKNFNKKIKVPKLKQVPAPPEEYMTKCMTCHKYYFIAEGDKRCCVCISGAYFIKLKNKYHW